MTLWHKRAALNLAVWFLVACGFALATWRAGGPGGLIQGTPPRDLAGIVLVCGIAMHLAIRWLTRERKEAPAPQVDERDREISRTGAEWSFALVAVGVFFACILLHDHYRAAGAVPVGWVWFLGYCTWILAYLVQAAVSVAMYVGVGGRAQG